MWNNPPETGFFDFLRDWSCCSNAPIVQREILIESPEDLVVSQSSQELAPNKVVQEFVPDEVVEPEYKTPEFPTRKLPTIKTIERRHSCLTIRKESERKESDFSSAAIAAEVSEELQKSSQKSFESALQEIDRSVKSAIEFNDRAVTDRAVTDLSYLIQARFPPYLSISEGCQEILHDTNHQIDAMKYSFQSFRSGSNESDADKIKSAIASLQAGQEYLNKMVPKLYDELLITHVNQEPIILSEFIRSMSDLCNILAQKYKVDFKYVLPGKLNQALIMGENDLAMRRILHNLIRNAMVYTQNVENPKVELIVEEGTGGYAKFIVKDNGPGMTPDTIGKLFITRGEAARSPSTNKTPGSGVGLNGSMKLVKSMGGEIKAESDGLGFGSTFWFTAPCEKNSPEEESIKIIEKRKIAKSDLWILIVEDTYFSAKALEMLCDNMGLKNIEIAKTGEEAIQFFATKPYGLVLTDTNLGDGMNGIAVTKWIREYLYAGN